MGYGECPQIHAALRADQFGIRLCHVWCPALGVSRRIIAFPYRLVPGIAFHSSAGDIYHPYRQAFLCQQAIAVSRGKFSGDARGGFARPLHALGDMAAFCCPAAARPRSPFRDHRDIFGSDGFGKTPNLSPIQPGVAHLISINGDFSGAGKLALLKGQLP